MRCEILPTKRVGFRAFGDGVADARNDAGGIAQHSRLRGLPGWHIGFCRAGVFGKVGRVGGLRDRRPVDAELAETHILDNEEESRAYIDQLWAEAMTIYNSGDYRLAFSPAMQKTLQAHQQDFMQEDAQAGMIYAFLEDYTGDRVCSKQLYAEALGNTNIPAEWETRAICEIMNTGISRGDIQGWQAHKTAKRYPKYGVQKGWERVTSPETGAEDFSEITDAEAKQLGFPF